jgi:protease-4
MGSSSVEDIREALIDFKTSKKFVVAYAELYTEKAYYLASVADRIYVNPGGEVEFNGMATTIPFFSGFLKKLEIEPVIFRVGDFKSAVEPFILDKMSDSSRYMTKVFLTSLNNTMVSNVAKSRGMTFEEAKHVQDSMLVRNANDAVKYKLATDVGYRDVAIDYIRKQLSLEKKDKLKLVTYNKVNKATKEEDKDSENRIAVIFAEGEIEGAESKDGIGSDEICAAIKKAREDDKIKAIVLRINSPGGSALASDIMWREVALCKGKKPVIASMGDVAASGGYYLAMGADTIVARPNTITGSIGVFGILFNVKGLLNNKLGVNADGVKTGVFSDLGEPSLPMTAGEKMIIQQGVNAIYDTFTTKAALGRRMPVETLKRYASGRVWSGTDAKQRGLVDVLGGLQTAIDIAASKAKLKAGDYELKLLPAQKDFFTELFEDFGSSTSTKMAKEQLGEFYPYIQQVNKLKKMQGVQARLPIDFVIE